MAHVKKVTIAQRRVRQFHMHEDFFLVGSIADSTH